MNAPCQNLTISSVTKSDIGTKLQNIKIQEPAMVAIKYASPCFEKSPWFICRYELSRF